MTLMVLGTSSNAGKSTICSIICRYMYRKGMDVVPFKASNLSSNAYMLEDGKVIGIGQAMQAKCCGLKPVTDMNPILIRPSDKGIEYLFHGISLDKQPSTKEKMKVACESFDSLKEKYGHVLCEGSGSPVEVNLIKKDIANIGIMKEREMDAIIVADIERGGVFAAIYGTWNLIPDELKPKLKGFIINRFRGDVNLLDNAISVVTKLTGMEYLGTMPYFDVSLPEEDTIPCNEISKKHIAIIDRLTDIAEIRLKMDSIIKMV